MQRVALYFGSFNPLHYGHLCIAEYVMSHCAVDRFAMVLSPHNPFKKSDDLSDTHKRLESLKRAVTKFNKEYKTKCANSGTQFKRLEVCDIELHLSEPLYTYCTLSALKERYPDCEFTLVVGADSLRSLPTWYRGEEILREYKVIVYPRKGYRVKTLCKKYNALYLEEAPLYNISSTAVREGKASAFTAEALP